LPVTQEVLHPLTEGQLKGAAGNRLIEEQIVAAREVYEAIHPPISGSVDQSLADKAICYSGTVGDNLCCGHIDRMHHYSASKRSAEPS
jgi:hypothetical protein